MKAQNNNNMNNCLNNDLYPNQNIPINFVNNNINKVNNNGNEMAFQRNKMLINNFNNNNINPDNYNKLRCCGNYGFQGNNMNNNINCNIMNNNLFYNKNINVTNNYYNNMNNNMVHNMILNKNINMNKNVINNISNNSNYNINNINIKNNNQNQMNSVNGFGNNIINNNLYKGFIISNQSNICYANNFYNNNKKNNCNKGNFNLNMQNNNINKNNVQKYNNVAFNPNLMHYGSPNFLFNNINNVPYKNNLNKINIVSNNFNQAFLGNSNNFNNINVPGGNFNQKMNFIMPNNNACLNNNNFVNCQGKKNLFYNKFNIFIPNTNRNNLPQFMKDNFLPNPTSPEPDCLNPYEILGIDKNSTEEDINKNFNEKLKCKDKQKNLCICLAYEMIINPSNYLVNSNFYKVQKKDISYYTIIGNLNKVKEEIKKDKNLLFFRDNLNRTLLHFAARNNYTIICKYLVRKGITLSEVDNIGRTALHEACHFGHESIVQYLINYGADMQAKTYSGKSPLDEAKTESIKKMFKDNENNKILNLLKKLYYQGMANILVRIKKDKKLVAIKIICYSSTYIQNFEDIKKNWIPVWHGTKYKNLESIVINNLKPRQVKLKNGEEIKGTVRHIGLNVQYNGVANWAKAVFLSPSILYCAIPHYAEQIEEYTQKFSCFIEAKIKPGSYHSYGDSSGHKLIPGEPSDLEYRLEVDENENPIYSPDTLHIFSVSFVDYNFLQKVKNYSELSFLVNSSEEKELICINN